MPSFPADSLNPASISQLCGSAYLTACARSMGAKSYPPSKGCSCPDASGCVSRTLGFEGGARSEPGGLADPLWKVLQLYASKQHPSSNNIFS